MGLEKKSKPERQDPRPTVRLFAEALTAQPGDAAYWCCVRALHRRGTREAFDIAASLALNSGWQERELGVRVIGQLGRPEREFSLEGEQVVLEVLQLESHPEVLKAIAGALEDTGSERSIPALIELSRHRDPEVRYETVYTLVSLEGDAVIARLVELTQDPTRRIREWATFGLASSDVDTPEIREVLLYRTRDRDEDTRDEAIHGLADRGDLRVLEPLLAGLAKDPGYLLLEAARALGDSRLYPALQKLEIHGSVDEDDLADALAACRPRSDYPSTT